MKYVNAYWQIWCTKIGTTDQGPEFVNRMIQELIRYTGTEQTFNI
jgi:hypothetical protein